MHRGIWPLGRCKKKLATAWHFQRTGGWFNRAYDCVSCNRDGEYIHRACRNGPDMPGKVRDSSGLIRYKHSFAWRPEHRLGDKAFTVGGCECEECPAGYITPESRELVQIEKENNFVHRASGATLCGLDASLWPAWWFDAVNVIEQCRSSEESARNAVIS